MRYYDRDGEEFIDADVEVDEVGLTDTFEYNLKLYYRRSRHYWKF